MKAFFSRHVFYLLFFIPLSLPNFLLSEGQRVGAILEQVNAGCELANQMTRQIQGSQRTATSEDMHRFLSVLSVDSFLDIMRIQTQGFKSMENALIELAKTSQTRYIPIIKKKFELSIAEREGNSKVQLEVLKSQEGQAIVQKMLRSASLEKLKEMLAAIEEQKMLYLRVKIKMPQYVGALYDAWEQVIKKELSEAKI